MGTDIYFPPSVVAQVAQGEHLQPTAVCQDEGVRLECWEEVTCLQAREISSVAALKPPGKSLGFAHQPLLVPGPWSSSHIGESPSSPLIPSFFLSLQYKHKSVLSKYDEEIEGEKKKSFKLDSVGMADGSWERELQQIRDSLHNRAQTLDVPGLRLASEYFSPEEMVRQGSSILMWFLGVS